jgi:lipopolysaccharide transport system permease protein
MRDIYIRYRQSVLGLLWPLLQPLAFVLILGIVFGVFAGFDSHNTSIPYALIILTGVLCWQSFANILMLTSDTLINNAELIRKTYFPRLTLLLSTSLPTLIDFLLTFCLFLVFCLYYQFPLTWKVFLVVPLCFQTLLLAMGGAAILAFTSVQVQDTRHLTPILLRLGFYASPIAYSIQYVPQNYYTLYILNPIAGLISAFRWALLDTPLFWGAFIYSIAFTLFIFGASIALLIRQEGTLADNL